MKKWKLLFVTVVSVFCLTACGMLSKTEETTVKFEKDGVVVNTIVEAFDEKRYDVDDLQDMVMKEVAAFNATSDAKGITVDKIEVKNGHVELVMTYSSAGQYSEFNGNILFYGTVQEAVDAGLNLDIQLVSTGKDKTTIGKNELLNMGDSKLVIVEEAMVVQMPSDIVYASENTNVLTGKKAKVLDTEEAAYFILK